MAQRDPFDDIPAPPPPGPDAPFQDSSNITGGYLAGSDDQEIRKIRRRITPFGKAAFLAVLVVGGGTAYFLTKTAMEEATIERLTREGREELRRITEQQLPREELARRVRDVYARNRSPEVRMAARRFLAGLNDPQAVPLLTEGLRGSTAERRQAALGLAEIGMPSAASARDTIVEVLPQTDPRVDRAEVAWAAVVLGDARAWSTVLDLLADGSLQRVRNLDEPPRNIFDAALVARMAGTQRLLALATDRRVALRRLAALTLGELATPDVVEGLLTLSRDADDDVAREASVGLGRTGDARAGDAITTYLNRHPDSREGVLTALQQNSGAPGLAVVIRAATNSETRGMAVRKLAELHDPGAAEAFLQALQSVPPDTTDEILKNLRNNSIFGLADIGDVRAAPFLMEVAERPFAPGAHVDPNMDQDTRRALSALAAIHGAATQVKDRLQALLPRAEFVRTQVLIALAAAADPSAGASVMSFLADEQAQEGAAIAVCRLHYAPGIARVRADLRRPANLRMNEETVQDEPTFIRRRNAIRAIAWTHDPAVAADLMRIVEDPLDRRLLREEAGHALAAVADDRALEEIATRALDTARTDEIRLYYLYALRGRSTGAISNRLVNGYLRPGTSAEIMRAAAVAAGFGGDDSTAALLRPLLESADGNVRLNAATAAVLCGDTPTANTLIERLVADRELPDLMTNVFVTRSATGNNTGVQLEPPELLPVTDSMFTDGRIYRRINMATALEHGRGANRYDFAMVWLKIRITNGWENSVLGIDRYAIRARLREAAQGTDEFRRDMAFRMLRALSDRGSLLALRRGSGDSAERARAILVEMTGTPGG